jgi:ElaA protein
MDIEIKTFKELDAYTLHDILQLRSSVFVVEQNCVYQDIDGKDKKSTTHFFKKKGLCCCLYPLFCSWRVL